MESENKTVQLPQTSLGMHNLMLIYRLSWNVSWADFRTGILTPIT